MAVSMSGTGSVGGANLLRTRYHPYHTPNQRSGKAHSCFFSLGEPRAQALGIESHDCRSAVLAPLEDDVRDLTAARPSHQSAALNSKETGSFIGGERLIREGVGPDRTARNVENAGRSRRHHPRESRDDCRDRSGRRLHDGPLDGDEVGSEVRGHASPPGPRRQCEGRRAATPRSRLRPQPVVPRSVPSSFRGTRERTCSL